MRAKSLALALAACCSQFARCTVSAQRDRALAELNVEGELKFYTAPPPGGEEKV